MKVIVAGFSKTGTKTMNAALTELGYTVYDYTEHFQYAADVWSKILTTGCSLDELKTVYKDADAICDLPACFFWDYFLEIFPKAKIILTQREDDGVWWRSLQGQMKAHNDNWIMRACYVLSWTGYKLAKFQNLLGVAVFGYRDSSWIFAPHALNERRSRQLYRRHNSFVLQCAPEDKLLVYNVKEGWEPLCAFLGESVPENPFPHKNARGSSIEEMMNKHPTFQQIKKEMMLSITLLIGLFSILSYICVAYILRNLAA